MNVLLPGFIGFNCVGQSFVAGRTLKLLREKHPDLKVTIVADGLFSKGPLIKPVLQLDFNYIISAKPKDHKYLFECFDKKEFFGGDVTHILNLQMTCL